MNTQQSNQDVSTNDIFAILRGDLTVEDIYRRRLKKADNKTMGREQTRIEADLAHKSTGELLKLLAKVRASLSVEHEYSLSKCGNSTVAWWAVKKVLATRPHVPNKIESKIARRDRAMKQRGQGKARNR